MIGNNRKRPPIDQERLDAPHNDDWELALVDDPTTWPQADEYGYGSLHCTLITPRDDFIQTGLFEYIEPRQQRKFCRPWTGEVGDLDEGTRIWVKEYGGFNIYRLAACSAEGLGE